MQSPRLLDGSGADSLTILAQEWGDFLRIEKGLSDNTVSNYQRDIAGYITFLHAQGIKDLTRVSEADIEAYMVHLRSGDKPLAASSVARRVSSVRSLHRYAVSEGYLAGDVTTELVVPRAAQRLPKALTLDEVSALLASAHSRQDIVFLRDAAILEVLYATGARVSEAVGLAADDLDLSAELPVVRLFGKGRKERLVPLGTYAREAVEAYLVRSRPLLAAKGSGATALFLNKRGKALSRQSVWEIIQTHAQAASLGEHVSPHTLRHSFATHLLEGGASVRDVQELLGHASVQTTQLYTKVTATTLREVHRSTHPRAVAH